MRIRAKIFAPTNIFAQSAEFGHRNIVQDIAIEKWSGFLHPQNLHNTANQIRRYESLIYGGKHMKHKDISPAAYEIKSILMKSGYTQDEIVELMATDYGWSPSSSNLSRKLRTGTFRYEDAMELAEALGYRIKWVEARNIDE